MGEPGPERRGTIRVGPACTGCGLCREICPKGPRVWEIDGKEGRKRVVVKDESFCLRCGMCATRCPVQAIRYHW
jgi:NAD-dependent dihydropyrimidine dehydrogenase PreA subunit